MKVKEEKYCRVCGGNLKVVLDLGEIVPSSFVSYEERFTQESAPLALAECQDCGLIQLKHTVDLDSMYRQYWYASALNKSMVSSLKDIVDEIESRIKLTPGDVVLDIGCNDGTLLGMYPKTVRVIGFEPALNIIKPTYVEYVDDYFNAEAYLNIYNIRKAKVITAIAMFYDLPDPQQFVEDVASVLHEDGIFVIQFTDLLSMYKVCAFDNICHEHLEYYKIADVKFLLETHGLEIIDISYNKVNGGSVRITAAHEGKYPKHESVDRLYNYEKRFMEIYGLEYFKRCMERAKIDIYNFLAIAKNLDMKVFLLGASTKGNTLLQVCEINSENVPYAAEVNKDKFGLYTAGTGIYIIPEDEALALKPNFFIVPIWHFKDSILASPKIRKFIEEGGTVVFPLPDFEYIDKERLDD